MLAVVTAAGFALAALNPYAVWATTPMPGGASDAAQPPCAGMGMAMGHRAQQPSGDQHSSGHQCCGGLGACCCAGAPAVVLAPRVTLPVASAARGPIAITRHPAPPAVAPQHRLPPSLGPPAFRA